MSFESIFKKKWWHTSLEITTNDRTARLLSRLSSYSSVNINTNALPNNIFAYAVTSNVAIPEETQIPVAAFDETITPGIFVYKPTLQQIFYSLFVAYSIEDINNSANRRRFFHYINAAFKADDTSCSATTPDTIDDGIYLSHVETNASIACVFPNLPNFLRAQCCSALFESPNILQPRFYDETILFILTSDISDRVDTNNPDLVFYIYRIYEYDYSLSGSPDALVLWGTIETPLLIYDICFVESRLIAITEQGCKEIIFPIRVNQNGTINKIFTLVDITTIFQNSVFVSPTLWFARNQRDFFSNKPCTIEYSKNNNKIYIKASPIISTGLDVDVDEQTAIPLNSTETPSIYECSLGLNIGDAALEINANRVNDQIPVAYTIPLTNASDSADARKFFGVYEDNLVRFDHLGPISYINRNNIFANINSLSFIKNPDELLRENILLATNKLGQIFKINTADATIEILPDVIPYQIDGITSTLGVQNLQFRQNVFPFNIRTSNYHWAFVIDTNIAAAAENESVIKPTFVNFVDTFLRQGDKVTFIFYAENVLARETFIAQTNSDITAMEQFINDNMIMQARESFIYNVTNLIAAEYRDVGEFFFLGKGNYVDVQYPPDGLRSYELFEVNLNRIATANPNSNFNFVIINQAQSGTLGLLGASTEALRLLPSRSFQIFWNI